MLRPTVQAGESDRTLATLISFVAMNSLHMPVEGERSGELLVALNAVVLFN
jgi:hypothetical protein